MEKISFALPGRRGTFGSTRNLPIQNKLGELYRSQAGAAIKFLGSIEGKWGIVHQGWGKTAIFTI